MYKLEDSKKLKDFIRLIKDRREGNARIFVYVLDEPNFFRGSKFKEAKLLLCYGNPFDKKKMILVSRNDLKAVLGKEYKKDLVLNMALMYKVLYEIGVEIANMIEKEGMIVPGKEELEEKACAYDKKIKIERESFEEICCRSVACEG
jgi:hypothetical protein